MPLSKLLVVTPNGPDADKLVDALRERGFTVERAATGSEALPVALQAPPAVILMDSALSAMDRWHAVKRLSGDPRTARLPVLTLSGDVHSPAGLQRLLSKLDETLGATSADEEDASMVATPVSASTRVAHRMGAGPSPAAVSIPPTPRRPTSLPPGTPTPANATSSAATPGEPPRRAAAARTPVPRGATAAHTPVPRSAAVRPTQPHGAVPPVRTPVGVARERIAAVQLGPRSDALDRGHILVVDDNDLNRDMLSRRLRRRGYEVETAEDGEVALRLLQSGRHELVLLDWMMPGMSGLDVLRKVRERWSAVQLPVIMATAKSEAGDIVEALRAEANDYVTKPLNFDVVHARVRTQLSLARAHQELLQSEQRYRALLENTGDMIVQYALDGSVLYASPASRALLGLEPAQVEARGWYELLHPIDRRELLSQSDAASLPDNFTYLARIERSDTSYLWVEVSCRALRDARGGVDMIQAACRDVSEYVERVLGDEPPLPLGGDIMAHPAWRSPTAEPPPARALGPRAHASDDAGADDAVEQPGGAAAVTPIVVIGGIEGLDAAVLRGMTSEQIGARVVSALRALAER